MCCYDEPQESTEEKEVLFGVPHQSGRQKVVGNMTTRAATDVILPVLRVQTFKNANADQSSRQAIVVLKGSRGGNVPITEL